MTKTQQTVIVEYSREDRATIRNQTITRITEHENFVAGQWKSQVVATWGPDSDDWYPVWRGDAGALLDGRGNHEKKG